MASPNSVIGGVVERMEASPRKPKHWEELTTQPLPLAVSWR
jgi:hypothetical protein